MSYSLAKRTRLPSTSKPTRIERVVNRLKQFRRVATRYDKTARNFLAFVHVASIMVLLR